MLQEFAIYNKSLSDITNTKIIINTINAHCYNISAIDSQYKEALQNSDILIPDGVAIVWAVRLLMGQKIRKIAGADLFFYEMEKLQKESGKCFFLGSTEENLTKIKNRALVEYPSVKIGSYSPPFKEEFSREDNTIMIDLINIFQPDVLFVGMTAPKQEKWVWQHFKQLKVGHICSIGAVFDFYAGTKKRAPKWMIKIGMEWFYRLIREPKRMWRRYLIGNTKFSGYIIQEKFNSIFRKNIV